MGNVVLAIKKRDLEFIEKIRKVVCDEFGMSAELMDLKTRKREIVQLRQVCMYFAKEYTKCSLATIGFEIGGKDHATVLHACRTVNDLMDTDRIFRGRMFKMKEIVEAKAERFGIGDYNWVCACCGSENVKTKAWIDPNIKKFIDIEDGVYGNINDNFCMDCQANTILQLKKDYDLAHGIVSPDMDQEEIERTTKQILFERKLESIKDEFEKGTVNHTF